MACCIILIIRSKLASGQRASANLQSEYNRNTYIGLTLPLVLVPKVRPNTLPTSVTSDVPRTRETCKKRNRTSFTQLFHLLKRPFSQLQTLPIKHLYENGLKLILGGTIGCDQHFLTRW